MTLTPLPASPPGRRKPSPPPPPSSQAALICLTLRLLNTSQTRLARASRRGSLSLEHAKRFIAHAFSTPTCKGLQAASPLRFLNSLLLMPFATLLSAQIAER